ncbi:hypothetical protein ACWCP8_37630 [Streptomyces sp. NPDC002206]
MSPHYEVQVLLHRIGRWWAVDIPRLGLHAQCRTLEHARTWPAASSPKPSVPLRT